MKSGGTVPKASLSLGHQQQLLGKLPPSESQRKRHIDPALLDFMPSLSARHAQLWLPRKCKPLLCVAFWTPPTALPKSQSQQHPLQGAHHARGSKDVLLAASWLQAFCQHHPNMGHAGKRAAGGIHAKRRRARPFCFTMVT